jgi:hyperosmotically inducible protein
MFKASAMVTWGALALLSIACAQTDAGITTAVKARLAADDTVKAYQIDVDTQEGVVTLSGEVDSTAAKDLAVSLATETEGVADVIDKITVEQADAGGSGVEGATGTVGAMATDATITASIKSKMMTDPTIGALQIDVDTSNGVVTLSGNVASAGERDRAVAVARETEGVRDVQDKITIKR